MPNGAGVADVTGQSGIPGLSLNPSALTFQPVIGDPMDNAANSVQVDLGQPPVTGPMSAQQYKTLLDPDRQREKAEMQQRKLITLKPSGFVDSKCCTDLHKQSGCMSRHCKIWPQLAH